MSEQNFFRAKPANYPDVKPEDPTTSNWIERNTDQGIQLHDHILTAVNSAATRLLRSSNFEENIIDMLTYLGGAAGVSCCAMFNITLKNSKPTSQLICAWYKPGSKNLKIETAINPYLARIGQTQDGLFLEAAALGNSPEEQSCFSLAILPIDQTDPSWGYLGFIDNEKEQAWTFTVRDALRSSTNLIAAILERNRFEERYKENEIRNRIIIDALPDLVIRIEASGKILDYTARKDHPLFINREEITGKMLSDIWPKNIVKKILHGNKPRRFLKHHLLDEFRLPFSNKVYESRLDPIKPQEALIVIRDVTDQAELKQMKSDFINRASHELRTPVTSAILMAELIQEGGSPQEIEEYWQILNSELNRQKILIDRLLIAGRLESGMMHLEISPIDLISILEESISALKPIARKKKISIGLNIPACLPKILGDTSGLQQVFINLINNAIKFSPEGSIVNVNATILGSSVQVAIIDQGMGITAHEIPNLFERFFRAREVTIAEIPGSGVGLFIVKSIIEGLGGKIELTHSSPAGTTFTATLRCAEGTD